MQKTKNATNYQQSRLDLIHKSGYCKFVKNVKKRLELQAHTQMKSQQILGPNHLCTLKKFTQNECTHNCEQVNFEILGKYFDN